METKNHTQNTWKSLEVNVCLENRPPHFSQRNCGFRLRSKTSAKTGPPKATRADGEYSEG